MLDICSHNTEIQEFQTNHFLKKFACPLSQIKSVRIPTFDFLVYKIRKLRMKSEMLFLNH